MTIIRPILLFALLTLQVQFLHAETLPDAVRLAIFSHPEIKAFLATRNAARANIKLAESLNRPNLSVSASGAQSLNGTASSKTHTTTLALSVAASQPIYDGGVARAEKRRSRSSAEAAEQRLNNAINLIGLQTTQAYIECMRLDVVRSILAENAAVLEEISGKVRQRVSGGLGSDADLYEAISRVEAARYQLAEIDQQLFDAKLNYSSLVGHKPDKLQPIQMLNSALPTTIEEAVSRAKTKSPKILAVRYDALAATASVESAMAQSRPKLDFVLGADDNVYFQDKTRSNYGLSAKINFRMSLYDGGASKARTREARYTAEATQYSADATALDIEREIRIAWSTVASSRKKSRILELQFKAARKSLDINLKRFDAGLSTLEKVMDLQSQTTAAELALLNEQINGRYNVFRILGGTGQLIAALAIDQSGAGQ
jgi:outer membrane protein, adhesin transport system